MNEVASSVANCLALVKNVAPSDLDARVARVAEIFEAGCSRSTVPVDVLTTKIRADKSNRITLIISHDERLIDLADEIVSLDALN